MTNFNKKILLKTLMIIVVASVAIFFSACKQGFLQNNGNYISLHPSKKYFPLITTGDSSTILLDSKDYSGIIKVSNLFQKDLYKLSGHHPQIFLDSLPNCASIILIGSINKNRWIQQLIKEKKLKIDDIENKWESSLIQVVNNPFPGIKKALVVTGSDKRGTIYSMLDISKKAGVSPWYWWADVPVEKKSALYIKNRRYVIPEPKVKYRGIFLNDEAPALSDWAEEKFGGFNHDFYEKVFELILRLKGNYLWPAMWGSAFYDDDSINGKLADEYGIVMGTSHHEPLGRAHDEWRRYGSGPWDYTKNASALNKFWSNGMKRMKSYDKIVTIGMRGDGDMGMSKETNTALLENIVHNQRQIIANITGKPAEETPQLWALYKEVQDYYNKGMRVPDDVTLLLCDDNWGNVRKLPNPRTPFRKGGYGMYYHFDFVGGPRNYKWLNTSPIPRIYEQLNLCYEHYVKRIWIVNVGDLKPMELPISFFFDYAWNPEKWNAHEVKEYTAKWAKKLFGEKNAPEIGELLNLYSKYNGRRTPELLDDKTYSLDNYREFETVVNQYQQLADKSKEIYNILPDNFRDAFYQLVSYPVQACSNLYQMYYALALNKKYAKEGRTATNIMADKVDSLYQIDGYLVDFYQNKVANGKWNHMMSQPHIGYTSWQQPDNNIKPEVNKIRISHDAAIGINVEGDSLNQTLPEFDAINQQSFYIEIYNKGLENFEYTITPSSDWIKTSSKQGMISLQKKIFVGIDWNLLRRQNKETGDKQFGQITIHSSGEKTYTIHVETYFPNLNIPQNTFIERNGYVSMDANNFTSLKENDSIHWQVISDLSRTGSGITTFPVTSSYSKISDTNPYLHYDFFLLHNPQMEETEVTLYFAPTQNFKDGNGLSFALSMDDDDPVSYNIHKGMDIPDWKYPDWFNKAVSNKTIEKKITLKIKERGLHTLKYYMIDNGLVLQKIVINNGGVKPSYLGPPESLITNKKS